MPSRGALAILLDDPDDRFFSDNVEGALLELEARPVGSGVPDGTYASTATGDGVTNDLPQIRLDLAAAAGGTLRLGPGHFVCLVTVAAQAFITAIGDTTIEGAGEDLTRLDFYAFDSGYHAGFDIAVDNFKLKNLSIRRDWDYGSVLFKLFDTVDNFATENCTFDGGKSLWGGQYSHGISYPNAGTVDTILTDHCTWTNFEYPSLTDNVSTATVNHIRWRDCKILANTADGIGFNAPNGTITDVGVEGCTIVGVGMGIDFAHVTGGFATNNFIQSGSDGIHVEDYSTNLNISNNTLYECAITGGAAPYMLLDSSSIKFNNNIVINTTALGAGFVCQALGAASGTTVGGRAKLGASHDNSISENTIIAGPNTAIWLMHNDNYKINSNTLKGGLAISSTYVESGTNTGSGIAVVGNENLAGTVNGNGISGFRYATYAPTNGQSTWQPGTTITGNTVSNCRYGIDGRTNRGVGISGNTISRCKHPMIVGAHGAGGAGAGCAPYSIVGNTMYDNQRQASIDGLVVIVATGAATIGAGKTLTIDPLLLDLISNRAITFSGGGILTTTTIGASGATSLLGTVASFNIAAGEFALVTGLYDRPHEAPGTVDNHTISGNTDSVRGDYMAVAASLVRLRHIGALPTASLANHGEIRIFKGGAGVLDRLVVCRKDAADAYAWVDLF